jgi:hypothetical protein
MMEGLSEETTTGETEEGQNIANGKVGLPFSGRRERASGCVHVRGTNCSMHWQEPESGRFQVRKRAWKEQ